MALVPFHAQTEQPGGNRMLSARSIVSPMRRAVSLRRLVAHIGTNTFVGKEKHMSNHLKPAHSTFEPQARGRALRLHSYGGPNSLIVDEVDAPEPGPGKVLVRVIAAAANGLDWPTRCPRPRRLPRSRGSPSRAGPVPPSGWRRRACRRHRRGSGGPDRAGRHHR